MDEIIALQAALAKAQSADTAHRVSERNAVEIVLKLIELKKVQLIFGKSGREYVTPAQVIEEVEMELISHNGRLTLVDLVPILNIDFNHIEVAARALVAKKKSIIELSGQLLTAWYLDGVVEEVNESLQETGSIGIVDLAQRFSLPAEFMRQTIEQRLGTLVQGYIEEGQLYTQSFIHLHTARTRGAFRALVKPTTLKAVITRHGLMENRVFKEVTQMIKEGVLSGTLKGSDDRALYTPSLFLRGQTSGAEAFFAANGFVEWKKMERLQIANPKAFVQAQFPTALHLQTLALSESLVSGCILACEDTAQAKVYMNAAAILPNVLSKQEVEQVLEHSIGVVNKQQKVSATAASADSTLSIMGEIWCVSSGFHNAAQKALIKQVEKYMDEEDIKVAEAAAVAAEAAQHSGPSASSSGAPPAASKSKASAARQQVEDEEDEPTPAKKGKAPGAAAPSKSGGKKGKRGGDSDSEEDSPAPSKAASKSAAKKGGGRKRAESSEDEEEPVAAPVKKEKSKSKPSSSVASSTTSPPIARAQLVKWLKAQWNSICKTSQTGNAEVQQLESDETTDELIGLLASALHPACLTAQKARVTARAAAAAALTPTSSSGSVSGPLGPGAEQILRRGQLEAFRTGTADLYEQVVMYRNAIDYLAGAAAGEDAKAATIKPDKTLIAALESHLSKTLASGLIDILLRMEAFSTLSASALEKIAACENMITLAPPQQPEPGKELTIAEKAALAKPRYEISRVALTPKERDQILAALPRRSSEHLKPLVESASKEPNVILERFEAAAKGLDFALKKPDKKTERSRIFAVRKSLMQSLATETRPAVILQLVILLIFAKVHSVVVHAPAKVLQSLRRLLRSEMQPIPYAKLRRYQQLIVKELKGQGEESSAQHASAASSSTSLGGYGSDSGDEAADASLPASAQIANLTAESLQAELQGGQAQIVAMGMDVSTVLKASK